MVVTGTEQRVYGTLTASNSCLIDLHRFALVSGSTTLSPPEASTVTYADTTPYKQCGHAYSGFITLLLLSSQTTVYAAVELRICKNDSKRIVLETYGQVKHTVTGGISLWFNKGSDAEPDWQLLNSAAYNAIMSYATASFTFKETKKESNGATLIDCCKACASCGCKNCDISNRFSVSATSIYGTITCCKYITITSTPSSSASLLLLNYGLHNLGDHTLYSAQLSIEYKFDCNTVYIWVYAIDETASTPYFEVYYRDDDGVNQLVCEGFGSDIGGAT